MKTLILYLSHDGFTQKIAGVIATYLADQCECNVVDLCRAREHDLQAYQRVVIGASIRYGHFAAELDRFIYKQLNWLICIPSAFYSVNLTARKADKCTPATNVYTRKFLAKTAWRPDLCAVFAGALRYPCYHWFDCLMIQLVMLMTGGETDCSKEVEYTDWQQVFAFARKLTKLTKNV
ncbi:MAG: protoporphyrinogen oxidase [Sodalis sp. Fle]|nr:MAG: protoporphyrinogen oxidase [Sodalis sp. Fle]